MSDLRVDVDVLDRVRGNLKHISDIMERPGREMDKVDGASMGVVELALQMNDFGREWSYGIKQINKFSDSAVNTLDKIKEAFEGLDDKLMKALEDSKADCR
ncbi:hypothetical protein [Streptomyces sp. NPDC090053]|uniref:hypothetical protein n=1 Tax=Streptomyces sp. NPDC090053 TaxID=3365932 RepID=UPI003830D3E1